MQINESLSHLFVSEFAGINRNTVDTNVFYKGLPEYNEHAAWPNVTDVTQEHLYEVDWNRERIIWWIDGKQARILYRENSTSPKIGPGNPFS
jgi:beta-glucanase (GH16 family)